MDILIIFLLLGAIVALIKHTIRKNDIDYNDGFE
jgi:hypothetical protein